LGISFSDLKEREEFGIYAAVSVPGEKQGDSFLLRLTFHRHRMSWRKPWN